MSALEDRYRRLLRSYPADHRRSYEDEMLGVLLAAAEPGRTRPALRDAFDLVRGGLGVRLRRAPGALTQAGWRDAAALAGGHRPARPARRDSTVRRAGDPDVFPDELRPTRRGPAGHVPLGAVSPRVGDRGRRRAVRCPADDLGRGVRGRPPGRRPLRVAGRLCGRRGRRTAHTQSHHGRGALRPARGRKLLGRTGLAVAALGRVIRAID
jgi:hypothetical protein